ncbi:hypothetical protein QAD02_008638 [Eretmocerus hayati]|uniref:Uncharacterized protein n=1 Tax=Eretmocerus hayati TaxID=131215 RepID=A0ACC2N7V8_9HYME|nr:hypothetical protein QAD02_008638 [Eretmocerus hayati]
MKCSLFCFLLTFYNAYVESSSETTSISCSDFKQTAIGYLLSHLSSSKKDSVEVDFYLATNTLRSPEKIDIVVASVVLQNSGFDPSKKTFIVIHGYKSGGRKGWVMELKDRLLDYTNANIILVDWTEGSKSKNYVNAVHNTLPTSNRIFNFLQTLRPQVEKMNNPSGHVEWNRFHFIGHSLGAQISGQTAHLLKQDDFWKVERITGLDPAKPCFQNTESSIRLDKDDADFVDIVHTNAGHGSNIDGFGLSENVGDIDFYVNGAVVQPQCIGSRFTPPWETMTCSHRYSYKYFTQSIDNLVNGRCAFTASPWDGTQAGAQRILEEKNSKIQCLGCPELGMNADKSTERGRFLVLLPEDPPYCQDIERDSKGWKHVLNVLRIGKNDFLAFFKKLVKKSGGKTMRYEHSN